MIGLVGKLPAHGDFVRRGGPAPVLSMIDRWLDTELTCAPDLADRIDALHGWRFAVELGNIAVLGVVVTSEDAVGRRFPILATRIGEMAAADADSWAEAASATLASGVAQGFHADTVAASLAEIAVAGMRGAPLVTGWWRAGEEPVLQAPVLPSGDAFARLFGDHAR